MKDTAFNLDELKQFIYHANMPHATGSANTTEEIDGSRTITFTEGKWSMHDNFFGGEPYGGRQIVHYNNIPAWLTVYYGRIHDTARSPDEIYGFLREALQHPPEDHPFRGPANYKRGRYTYRSHTKGAVDNYSCHEVILENDKEIYWATFIGGLVDQRFQGGM